MKRPRTGGRRRSGAGWIGSTSGSDGSSRADTGSTAAPEQTLHQIGRDMGISKERVRQIANRAQAKLRGFARVEAFEPFEI